MPYANDYFQAYLESKITATDAHLPVCAEAKADLLRFIPNGSYTYASLVDDTNMETVIIRNEYGELILERGIEDTTPVAHPLGTCVRTVSPTAIAAIKDLICNWKCCEE